MIEEDRKRARMYCRLVERAAMFAGEAVANAKDAEEVARIVNRLKSYEPQRERVTND